MTKTIQFAKSGYIDPDKVKIAVYNRIDFELPDLLWDKISNAFGECWNNEIGLRGWIHEGQIEKFIYEKLKADNILFDFQRIEEIVQIIFDYIEMTGGFLDE